MGRAWNARSWNARSWNACTWIAFGALMYLLLSDLLWHWIQLPQFGSVGFTLVFLLFSLLHCYTVEGGKETAVLFVVAGLVSFALEELGVRTGLVYGRYHYSDMLGLKLLHVPVLIPLAWFMMIYPSWVVARALLRGVYLGSVMGIVVRSAVAAMVMTGWDAVMDPGMAAGGNWVWEQGGSYFGVPLRNYAGWVLTTFLVYLAAGWMRRAERVPAIGSTFYRALPVIVYAFYGCVYVMPRPVRALEVVALWSMVLPGSLALLQLFGRRANVVVRTSGNEDRV